MVNCTYGPHVYSEQGGMTPRLEPHPALLGIASVLPDRVLTNADLERMVDTSDQWITERTGIKLRHLASEKETASVLGARASEKVLDLCGSPDIDLIITTTCTGDTLVPPTACLIQRHLGMKNFPAFDVNAACSGFIYGMATASSYIRSGLARNVLLVSTEVMSSIIDYEDRSTCVLFGDGAAAILIGTSEEETIPSIILGANGQDAHHIVYEEKPTGKSPAVRMNGKETYRTAVDKMCSMIDGVANEAGWGREGIDLIIPHQANYRIMEAVAQRMSLPLDKIVSVIDHMGNTSSASIPLALDEAARLGRLHDGDRIACVAFGAGATWGGVALKWSESCRHS